LWFSLERLLKILIPYGDLERPDKLHHRLQAGRLDGHQNFSTVPLHAKVTERQAEGDHKSKRPALERKIKGRKEQ
jgi:hypothetical protein